MADPHYLTELPYLLHLYQQFEKFREDFVLSVKNLLAAHNGFTSTIRLSMVDKVITNLIVLEGRIILEQYAEHFYGLNTFYLLPTCLFLPALVGEVRNTECKISFH